jgi:hypothetical protein
MACTEATSCTLCVPGFIKGQNGLCKKCESRGCVKCSDDGVDCTECLKGFYLADNECKKCPGFCKDCTSATVCNELVISNFLVLLLIDGKSMLAVCDSNCITCSNKNPEICLECSEGYFLKGGKCRRCSGSCNTCDETDPSKCLSCYPSNFLTGTTCVVCNQTCMTCEGANGPNKCTSCWDGYHLKGTECVQGCPENCFACSSPTTCTECLSGFTFFNDDGSLICAPCVSSCRTCAEGQPAECLECGEGFYLAGKECAPCSENCATCSAAGCTACAEDFFMT